MADISTYLQAIQEAVYGEEVRGAIHDAILEINDQVEDISTVREDCIEQAGIATEQASSAHDQAQAAHDYAITAINEANSIFDSVNIFNRENFGQYGFIKGHKFLRLQRPFHSRARISYDTPTSTRRYHLNKIGTFYDEFHEMEINTEGTPETDYIQKNIDCWYISRACYGVFRGNDYPFNQIEVNNCINLTENPSGTVFEDTFELPAIKDNLTDYFIYIPESSDLYTRDIYIKNSMSLSDSETIAHLRINKDSYIDSLIAYTGISSDNYNNELFLTPIMTIEDAINFKDNEHFINDTYDEMVCGVYDENHDLYKKLYYINSISSGTVIFPAKNDIEKIIKAEGYLYKEDHSQQGYSSDYDVECFVNSRSANNELRIKYRHNHDETGSLTLDIGSSIANSYDSICITIYYTKRNIVDSSLLNNS